MLYLIIFSRISRNLTIYPHRQHSLYGYWFRELIEEKDALCIMNYSKWYIDSRCFDRLNLFRQIAHILDTLAYVQHSRDGLFIAVLKNGGKLLVVFGICRYGRAARD